MRRYTVAQWAQIGRRGMGSLATALADVCFPSACRACGAHAEAGSQWSPLLCRACGAGMPVHDAPVRVPPPLAAGHAFARFEAAARILLIDLKYAGVLRAGRTIGRRMARAPGAGRLLRTTDLVVPVPLHWRRRWGRGHNQAAVLAGALCAGCGLASVAALRRRRATRPQVDLDRAARLANVGGAFRLRERHRQRVAGASVLLIDDVVTTGATAAEAGYALRVAGAGSVRLYAAACAGPLQHGPRATQPRPRNRRGERCAQASSQRKPVGAGAGSRGLAGSSAGSSGRL